MDPSLEFGNQFVPLTCVCMYGEMFENFSIIA